MKLQRIMVLSLGAILLGRTPGLLWANESGMDQDWAAHRVEHMTQKLKLTPEQQTQLTQILKDKADQMKPLHEQMKTIHDQSEEKITALLTDEQKKKYQEMKEKRQEKMHKGYKTGAKP